MTLQQPENKATAFQSKNSNHNASELHEMTTSSRSQRKGRQKTQSMIPWPTDSDVPPECAGTCFSITWEDGTHKLQPHEIMEKAKSFCETSKSFIEFCERAGLHGLHFTWNKLHDKKMKKHATSSSSQTQLLPSQVALQNHFRKINSSYATPSSSCSTLTTPSHTTTTTTTSNAGSMFHRATLYDKFWAAYERDADMIANVAIVFHGTAEDRIPKILKQGLDPKYRTTQAFGNGEYFSKEPGLATTYCKGGHQILVYLVFIPEDNEKYYSQRDRDIVLMTNIDHQLPIGVLTFEEVDTAVVQHTQDLRIEQKALKEDAIAKEKELKVAKKERGDDTTYIQELENQVRDSWDLYYRFKLDEHRNTMEHIRLESSQ